MESIARIHALTGTLDKITNLTSALVQLCVMDRELDAPWGVHLDLFKMGVTSSVLLFLGRVSRHQFCPHDVRTRANPAVAKRVITKCRHLLTRALLKKYKGEAPWMFEGPPCGGSCVKTCRELGFKTRTAVLIHSSRAHDVMDMGTRF